MALSKYFNNNLKYLRQQRKMTQQELADKLIVDRSTISRWENGDMDATINSVLQITEILDISLENLLTKDLTDKGAKEMFEELGYELYVNNEITLGYVCERKEDYINFYKEDNDISVCCGFNTDILKAINKQVEELGWK